MALTSVKANQRYFCMEINQSRSPPMPKICSKNMKMLMKSRYMLKAPITAKPVSET